MQILSIDETILTQEFHLVMHVSQALSLWVKWAQGYYEPSSLTPSEEHTAHGSNGARHLLDRDSETTETLPSLGVQLSEEGRTCHQATLLCRALDRCPRGQQAVLTWCLHVAPTFRNHSPCCLCVTLLKTHHDGWINCGPSRQWNIIEP